MNNDAQILNKKQSSDGLNTGANGVPQPQQTVGSLQKEVPPAHSASETKSVTPEVVDGIGQELENLRSKENTVNVKPEQTDKFEKVNIKSTGIQTSSSASVDKVALLMSNEEIDRDRKGGSIYNSIRWLATLLHKLRSERKE